MSHAETVTPTSRHRPHASFDDWFAAELQLRRADVHRLAHWLCDDPAAADDLTQDTLLRAWRFRHTLDDRARFKAWLLAIARREHARMFERKRLPTVHLDELSDEEHPVVVDECLDDTDRIHAAIMELKPAARQVIVLKALCGYSVAEIASTVGVSSMRVSVRLFRARETLKLSLAGVW